jgi:hypothetical protein
LYIGLAGAYTGLDGEYGTYAGETLVGFVGEDEWTPSDWLFALTKDASLA